MKSQSIINVGYSESFSIHAAETFLNEISSIHNLKYSLYEILYKVNNRWTLDKDIFRSNFNELIDECKFPYKLISVKAGQQISLYNNTISILHMKFIILANDNKLYYLEGSTYPVEVGKGWIKKWIAYYEEYSYDIDSIRDIEILVGEELIDDSSNWVYNINWEF